MALPPAHDALVVLAIVVSRAEALVIASVLDAAGIHVWIDGEAHASVDPISVALGGHRLRVPAWQHSAASKVVREVGLEQQTVSYKGGRLAIIRFLAVLVGSQVFIALPAVIAGVWPWFALTGILFSPLGVPVDPRGRAQYMLVDGEA